MGNLVTARSSQGRNTAFVALCAITLLLLLAAAARLQQNAIGPSDFVLPDVRPVVGPAETEADLVARSPVYAHSLSAVTLDKGEIAAFWFTGTREGDADARLMTARFDGTTWSAPVALTNGPQTGSDEGRYVKTVGNPVVFRHPDGEYWLVYVSVSVGGWSGSALNLKRSPDGIHWGAAQRLTTGPFFNLSTLAKGQPLIRSDGLVALPVYHEFIARFPELLFLDPNGSVVGKVRMAGAGRCAIQPAPAALGGGRAIALLRNAGCEPPRLLSTVTEDGGLSWSPLKATPIANPNAPAAIFRLADGQLLAVANDNPRVTHVLYPFRSANDGRSWTRGEPLFDGTAGRTTYRYPFLLQDGDGRLHLFVTEVLERREWAIRHLVLDPALLAAEGGGDGR
jgi:predicted neuraminidase